MLNSEQWKASRERITLDVPLEEINTEIEVELYEKFAFGDPLDSHPEQIEVELVDGILVAHVHLHRLNFAVPEDDESYDADLDAVGGYDYFDTGLNLAVFKHGEPYPFPSWEVNEDEWNSPVLISQIDIGGILHDVVAIYDED